MTRRMDFLSAERKISDLADRLAIELRKAAELLQDTDKEDAVYLAENVAYDLSQGEDLGLVLRALQQEVADATD